MQKIKKTQDLVEDILTESRDARNSDNYLCVAVYRRLLADKGINIDHMSAPTLFLNINKFGLPTIETIGRTRRKLQAQYLYLRSDADIAKARDELQEVFKEYAKE